jgi:hypothetical protein
MEWLHELSLNHVIERIKEDNLFLAAPKPHIEKKIIWQKEQVEFATRDIKKYKQEKEIILLEFQHLFEWYQKETERKDIYVTRELKDHKIVDEYRETRKLHAIRFLQEEN